MLRLGNSFLLLLRLLLLLLLTVGAVGGEGKLVVGGVHARGNLMDVIASYFTSVLIEML